MAFFIKNALTVLCCFRQGDPLQDRQLDLDLNDDDVPPQFHELMHLGNELQRKDITAGAWPLQ